MEWPEPEVRIDPRFIPLEERASLNVGNAADAEADAQLWTEFYLKPVLNTVESQKAGRQIWEEKVYLKIGVPGDRDVVDRPYWISETHPYSDSARFGDRYLKWKASKNQNATVGTPLSLLAAMQPPILDLGKVKELEFLHVTTAEQLVGMPDVLGQKFMGFPELKRKVQGYLELQAADAPNAMMREQLEARDAQLSALGEQNLAMAEALREMKAQLAQMNAGEVPTPVRRRRNAVQLSE